MDDQGTNLWSAIWKSSILMVLLTLPYFHMIISDTYEIWLFEDRPILAIFDRMKLLKLSQSHNNYLLAQISFLTID